MDLRKVAQQVSQEFTANYKHTPAIAKACDACVVFGVVSALLQLLYVALTSSFPFNSLLAGLANSVGFAVLTLCLRMKVTDGKTIHPAPVPQKAMAEYCFAFLFLQLLVWVYIG
mmetsp:Transcript_13351/g.40385  ORF Transcript_13351/g.40385 Transcript_13351/m.40385 type:complete len:114 (+) Transcript_13351:194-535(+)